MNTQLTLYTNIENIIPVIMIVENIMITITLTI